MAVSDIDIHRTAHLWIQQHGEQAVTKAREIVEAMRRKGDDDGADTWLRIIAAIGTLGPHQRTRGIKRWRTIGSLGC